MQNDEIPSPKPNMSLPKKVLFTYHIKDTMGHDLPSPPINSEDLETNWHLFELRISAEELKDHNYPSQPKLQPIKSNHSYSTMALKMRGSINDATKAKARAIVEPKKKATEEEKKMSMLQHRLSKIKKTKLDEQNWPKYSV
jgi:hypothetical protein